MSTLPDPWMPDSPTLLTKTLSHRPSAHVVTPGGDYLPLDVEAGRVSFDDTRAPRVSATITAKVPDDVALLGRIDPRTGCGLVVEAGYARPDGIDDVHTLADIKLRERVVTRPDNLLTLTAMSRESLVLDNNRVGGGAFTKTDTVQGIQAMVDGAIGAQVWSITSGVGPAISQGPYADRWGLAADLANQIGAQVYDDGTGLFHIDPVPVIGTPALTLTVGEDGTLTQTDARLARDGDGVGTEWANQVRLVYRWRDTSDVDHTITSTRRVTTGAYAATTGNTKTLEFEYEHATTQAQADANAAATVARTVTRGRTLSLTAVSAYWLRPGDTVTVQLPTGDPEKHLVSSVEFDLLTGLMDVTTRLPDNLGTIGA